jgi:hypothetical protein
MKDSDDDADEEAIKIKSTDLADSCHEENSKSTKTKLTSKSKKSDVLQTTESLQFDSKSIENKPKGLVDSLTKYFTPGKLYSDHQETENSYIRNIQFPDKLTSGNQLV